MRCVPRERERRLLLVVPGWLPCHLGQLGALRQKPRPWRLPKHVVLAQKPCQKSSPKFPALQAGDETQEGCQQRQGLPGPLAKQTHSFAAETSLRVKEGGEKGLEEATWLFGPLFGRAKPCPASFQGLGLKNQTRKSATYRWTPCLAPRDVKGMGCI